MVVQSVVYYTGFGIPFNINSALVTLFSSTHIGRYEILYMLWLYLSVPTQFICLRNIVLHLLPYFFASIQIILLMAISWALPRSET